MSNRVWASITPDPMDPGSIFFTQPLGCGTGKGNHASVNVDITSNFAQCGTAVVPFRVILPLAGESTCIILSWIVTSP